MPSFSQNLSSLKNRARFCYLCWTNFERSQWEGLHPPTCHVEKRLQLLALPLLEDRDCLIVTDCLKKEKNESFVTIEMLKRNKGCRLRSFAWNRKLWNLCVESEITPCASWVFDTPLQLCHVEPIKELNSKSFLHRFYQETDSLSQEIPGTTIGSWNDLQIWTSSLRGPTQWRCKPILGHAGRDQLLFSSGEPPVQQKLERWLEKIDTHGPIKAVVEENKHRFADISTFWEILPNQSVVCWGYSNSHCSQRGRYLGATIYPEKEATRSIDTAAFALWMSDLMERVKACSLPGPYIQKALMSHFDLLLDSDRGLLKNIADTGYCGPVTIDSLVTHKSNRPKDPILIPCDLNVRMSYGRVMLEILRKKNPQAVKYTFSHRDNSLLH